MISNTVQILSEHSQVLLACVTFSFLYVYYYLFSPRLRSLDVPSIDGKDGPLGKEFCSAIKHGTKQYPDQIYKLNTFNYETVIIPHRYIDEIKSMPEKNLSLLMELYERHLGRFTTMATVSREPGFLTSIKMDLNKHLAETITPLFEETRHAVDKNIGLCKEWKLIKVHHQSLQLVARLTGRIFVGAELSRNKDWTKASIQTTEDTFAAAFILWYFHWLIRPLIAWCLPQIWNVQRHNRRMAQLISPFIRERLSAMSKPDSRPSFDMLQYFLENFSNKNPVYQGKLHSAVNVAAIHTTSMNVTHLLFDLAAYPEYIAPLRDEIETALLENNSVVDRNFLNKLRKLDSFMRESQRISPPQIVSMGRKVQADTVLSDGVTLPEGCLVACDAWSATRDPEVWDEPEKFDGFRFERLRTMPGNEAKYQFVATSSQNLAFGHGSHACPGRFFVVNEIKILISHIIQKYDIMLKPGCKRPQNIYFNTMILPDTEAQILLRSRSNDS